MAEDGRTKSKFSYLNEKRKAPERTPIHVIRSKRPASGEGSYIPEASSKSTSLAKIAEKKLSLKRGTK